MIGLDKDIQYEYDLLIKDLTAVMEQLALTTTKNVPELTSDFCTYCKERIR